MGFVPIFCFCNLRLSGRIFGLSCGDIWGLGVMQDLHTLIETSVSQLGFELVDLEISNRGKLLRVFIDKQNPADIKDSVNIDDCSLVSNQLGNLLAVENDIDYDRLEVSSPGMDRVLKKEADFVRFIDERATVKIRVPIIEIVASAKTPDKEEKITKKNFVGFIRGVEDSQLLLDCDGVTYKIALSNIEKSRLNPVF
jgi:ribosome maturation factor RimP